MVCTDVCVIDLYLHKTRLIFVEFQSLDFISHLIRDYYFKVKFYGFSLNNYTNLLVLR